MKTNLSLSELARKSGIDRRSLKALAVAGKPPPPPAVRWWQNELTKRWYGVVEGGE